MTTIFQNVPKTRISFISKWHTKQGFYCSFLEKFDPKWGFVQKFNIKSEGILEKVPCFLKMTFFFFFWYPKRDPPCSPSSPKINHACLHYYTWLPPPQFLSIDLLHISHNAFWLGASIWDFHLSREKLQLRWLYACVLHINPTKLHYGILANCLFTTNYL